MPLIARAKSRGPPTVDVAMRGETPKKVSWVKGCCFFSFSLKCKISSLKEKVKIISESELEICALIYRPQLKSISVSIFLFTSVAVAFERQMFLLAHRL